MSNEWFERGELPPVGVEFEAYWPLDDEPKWAYFKCEYLSNQNAIFSDENGKEYSYRPEYVKKGAKLRPIRTEREKAIEAAISAASDGLGHASCGVGHVNLVIIANSIYDAGLLRLPEDK